uniref:Ribonuclease H-like domain-containing protein n=1 Tax=Tanacetum cinerariifolium TaxID=118510 RepID=A0A6L2LVI1_TANCI|nr:ribonuclease H-like domain-containing protein [Tanacetum cinerariifolium]
MVTTSQSGIVKPIERLSFHTSSLSPIPKSLFIAPKDPNWCNAMYDEYNALVKNGTWILVPNPSDVNLARLVANGSNQQHSVNFDETFSPVVKPTTIHTVLRPAVSRQWLIHQLDVKNAFLYDDLSETVYMHQPHGFVNSLYPNHVCLLQRYLYGLKQAPRFSGSLHKEFDMVDLGALNYFLGISVVRHPTVLFLSQKKYALQLLEHAHMVNCNPSRTPVDIDSNLGLDSVPTGFPSTHRSTSGYSVFLDTAWIRNLLRKLHSPFLTATLVYCDKVSAVYMSANPVQHQRTKHIEIDIHFVRDMVKAGHVRVLHVPSHFQYADIFTKGLPLALFKDFRSSLRVPPPPTQSARAY